MSLRILLQDQHLVAVEKPAGFHVHPPEDNRHKISNSVNCLYLLRQQLGAFVYPIHRLDRSTSGVLLFALQPETAKVLCRQFSNQEVKKKYFCVVRGWTPLEGEVDHPLRKDFDSEQRVEATTRFEQVAKIELPYEVGKYQTSRYSLVSVNPLTGRTHQIRRHFSHLSHPLVGDTVYGKGPHNRLFRDELKISGLLLKAYSLEFSHPVTGEKIRVRTKWNSTWHKIFDLFGICPFIQGKTPDIHSNKA